MRLAGAATVPGVDLAVWARVLPALFDRWKELRFVDGVFVDSTGTPRHGLAPESGSHPLPGAAYRLVTGSETLPEPTAAESKELRTLSRSADKSERDIAMREWIERRRASARSGSRMEWTWNTWSLELLESSPESFAVRIQDRTATSIGAVVSFTDTRPGTRGPEVSVNVRGGIEGRWPIRGDVSGHADLVFDLASPGERHARLVGHGNHTRAAGRAKVTVDEVGADTVDVSAVVHLHARGVLRPLAAVVALFAGGKVRQEFSSMVRALPDEVAALNRRMLETIGPALTPESDADYLFVGFLETIATDRPDT